MNCIKKSMACAMAVGCAMLANATPEVGNVTMTQRTGSRLVTITYKLTEDAVVTLDVLTNATPNAATGWASIGGKAICNAQGAVWRKVTSADADGSGNYTITWRPDNSWTDEFGNGFKIADGCAKAVVTAYALDNTPDYMVVDISASAQQNTQQQQRKDKDNGRQHPTGSRMTGAWRVATAICWPVCGMCLSRSVKTVLHETKWYDTIWYHEKEIRESEPV